MKLSAVILAAGQSRRMGRDKAWIEFDGQSLIARGIATARKFGAGEIFISGRPDVDYSALPYPVLLDLQPGSGPLGGIERGLAAARFTLVLFLAIDMPQITTDLLRRLYDRCGGSDTGAVPILNGRPEPLAAIYPKQCHHMALRALAEGRLAARSFADECLKSGAVHPYQVELAESFCFENWNTPTDLRVSQNRTNTV